MEDQRAEGWLQRRMYREGEVWLLCYYMRGLTGVVEERTIIPLVRDYPREEDAWRQAKQAGCVLLTSQGIRTPRRSRKSPRTGSAIFAPWEHCAIALSLEN